MIVNNGRYNGIDIFKVISVGNIFSDTKEALDLMVYEKQGICEMAHEETGYPDLAYTCSNFKLLNSTKITIGSMPAYEIAYTEERTLLDGTTKYTRTAWEIVMPIKTNSTVSAWDFDFGTFEDVNKYQKMLKDSVYSFRIP